MLKRIRFRNFRCLRSLDLELGPLTVLIGPNSSGKSSVLAGLDYAGGIMRKDAWRRDPNLVPDVELHMDNGAVFLPVVVQGGENRGFSVKWKVSKPGTKLPKPQLLHLDLGELRRDSPVTEAEVLNRSGSNLTSVILTLPRSKQAELAAQLARFVPVFSDVSPRPTKRQGHFQLMFQDRWDADTWYQSYAVSDGTLLVLAYLLTQYQRPQVDLLAIEEPERGLHPYLLGELVNFLRRMSQGQVGSKPVQIVLATHSAELLDCLRPEEVRVLTRDDKDGGVRVEGIPSESSNWREALREHQDSIGSVWLSGGIGGVPRT